MPNALQKAKTLFMSNWVPFKGWVVAKPIRFIAILIEVLVLLSVSAFALFMSLSINVVLFAMLVLNAAFVAIWLVTFVWKHIRPVLYAFYLVHILTRRKSLLLHFFFIILSVGLAPFVAEWWYEYITAKDWTVPDWQLEHLGKLSGLAIYTTLIVLRLTVKYRGALGTFILSSIRWILLTVVLGVIWIKVTNDAGADFFIAIISSIWTPVFAFILLNWVPQWKTLWSTNKPKVRSEVTITLTVSIGIIWFVFLLATGSPYWFWPLIGIVGTLLLQKFTTARWIVIVITVVIGVILLLGIFGYFIVTLSGGAI